MTVVSYTSGEKLRGAIDRFQMLTAPGDGADIDFHFPATLRPRLVMIRHGAASLVAPDGNCTPLPAVFIAAPKGAPRTNRIMPGTEFIVAVFLRREL
ncbi:MAG: hypothetical protein V4631_21525 [Pseudomonadota bacterium]